MKKNTILAIISTFALSAHVSNARETVITTGISSGLDYSDRSYDDDINSGVVPPVPPPDMVPSRNDERADIVISPTISIYSKADNDSALLDYRPSISYNLMESESNDINHELSAGYQRELTSSWDFKMYNLFKNTDDFETERPQEESLSDSFVEELTSSIPSMNGILRDEFGRRRYTRNELSLSTGLNYFEGNRIALGYGWDHLEYDEGETSSETYQDYDKYNVNLALSHELSSMWTVKGYAQYVRGVFETENTSDDDLDEYHLGGMLTADIIPSHPLTLSYDFSQTNYDDDSADSSQIHNMTMGYRLISSPLFQVSLGAGPTYTKYSDSEDSWDANGNLNILYKMGRGSFRFTSDIGTQFDNFSGTDERALTDYWQSRAEYSYPWSRVLEIALYCGYRDETRDEVDSGMEIDVERMSAGGVLKYNINENFDAGLNYDYSVQESDREEDSYDEHQVRLMLSYKTDLFSW